MKSIKFAKFSGAGNDFIAINNKTGWLKEEGREQIIAKLCQRRVSIGADGVIIIEPSTTADFRMRYYNSDGREAETCGNGSRCIARFAYLEGAANKIMTFETAAGVYNAEVKDDGNVIVDMTEPYDLRTNIALAVKGFKGVGDFINTGVPHVVIYVDDLKGIDVFNIGRAIRFHEIFQPAGTNVNFITIIDEHAIEIRTYERGVEDETLACGTGSIAAAVIAGIKGEGKSPVTVKTKSGVLLTIYYSISSKGEIQGVRLEGEARLVYIGETRESISEQ